MCFRPPMRSSRPDPAFWGLRCSPYLRLPNMRLKLPGLIASEVSERCAAGGARTIVHCSSARRAGARSLSAIRQPEQISVCDLRGASSQICLKPGDRERTYS
jgi:hypothetical protein